MTTWAEREREYQEITGGIGKEPGPDTADGSPVPAPVEAGQHSYRLVVPQSGKPFGQCVRCSKRRTFPRRADWKFQEYRFRCVHCWEPIVPPLYNAFMEWGAYRSAALSFVYESQPKGKWYGALYISDNGGPRFIHHKPCQDLYCGVTTQPEHRTPCSSPLPEGYRTPTWHDDDHSYDEIVKRVWSHRMWMEFVGPPSRSWFTHPLGVITGEVDGAPWMEVDRIPTAFLERWRPVLDKPIPRCLEHAQLRPEFEPFEGSFIHPPENGCPPGSIRCAGCAPFAGTPMDGCLEDCRAFPECAAQCPESQGRLF